MNIRFSLLCGTALLLSACAAGPNVAGNWKHIGNTGNGNIRVYIDRDSIRKNGASVVFRDRKVVQNPERERYVNMPAYKTAVGTWEIHCTQKTYRLSSLQLLAEDGREVFGRTYPAAMIQATAIPAGSLAEVQRQTVCDR
ncbi:MAG: hypothetical protein Q4A49_05155 [Neisseria sp.]|nr:hypothetical protein [Neisseria sp.]